MPVYEMKVKRMKGHPKGSVVKVRIRAKNKDDAVGKFNRKYDEGIIGPGIKKVSG